MDQASKPTIRRTAAIAGVFVVAVLCTPAGSSTASQPSCHGHRATMVGTDRKDRITGTKGRDVIVGRGGADRINAKGGNDLVCGGAGRDTIAGGRGKDLLDGQLDGRHWDEGWFYVGDVLGGGPGSDRIIGGDGHTGDHATFINSPRGIHVDIRKGRATGQGKDRLVGIESVSGSDHADSIVVETPTEATFGRGGADTLTATGYAWSLSGGPGDDQIRLERGGAAGGDDGNDSIEAVGRRGSDLDGGPGDDRIVGGPGDDFAAPGDGVDTVSTHGGDDSIEDGNGDDSLRGGPGNDYIANARGNARLMGGAGNDTLRGGAGDDEILGGAGSDTTNYLRYGLPAVRVDLAAGTSSGGHGRDNIEATENITGSPYDDVLRGDAGPNNVDPDDGDDIVRTVDGDDRIRELFGTVDVDAGPGDDAIAFDYRDDSVRGNRLVGGAGADTFDLGGSFLGGDDPAGLVVDLDQGFVRARGTVDLLGFENVIGGWSASTLIGNDADNLLRGGPRTDIIEGRAGDDHLDGRDGADTGDGGTGTDTCTAFETVTACEN